MPVRIHQREIAGVFIFTLTLNEKILTIELVINVVIYYCIGKKEVLIS